VQRVQRTINSKQSGGVPGNLTERAECGSNNQRPMTAGDQLRATIKQFGAIDMSDNLSENKRSNAQRTQTAGDFMRAQLNDRSLESFWIRAKAGSAEFCIISGLLYRCNPENLNSMYEFSLVIPEGYRKQLLEVAHDNVTSWQVMQA